MENIRNSELVILPGLLKEMERGENKQLTVSTSDKDSSTVNSMKLLTESVSPL